jgi:hypothetical protein
MPRRVASGITPPAKARAPKGVNRKERAANAHHFLALEPSGSGANCFPRVAYERRRGHFTDVFDGRDYLRAQRVARQILEILSLPFRVDHLVAARAHDRVSPFLPSADRKNESMPGALFPHRRTGAPARRGLWRYASARSTLRIPLRVPARFAVPRAGRTAR